MTKTPKQSGVVGTPAVIAKRIKHNKLMAVVVALITGGLFFAVQQYF